LTRPPKLKFIVRPTAQETGLREATAENGPPAITVLFNTVRAVVLAGVGVGCPGDKVGVGVGPDTTRVPVPLLEPHNPAPAKDAWIV